MSNASILLFSDSLLDRPYPWAPPELAAERREAARQAITDIVGIARRERVDAIACAGGLFHGPTVMPATVNWLATAFRSAGMPVLVAPGDDDWFGAPSGYSIARWPENVTVFSEDHLIAVEVGSGVTVWGGAHTRAHRYESFLLRRSAGLGDGIQLALFHGAETGGLGREPNDETTCAEFTEDAVTAAGFDHALVGHFRGHHLGDYHTYPGAPIAHDPGGGCECGVVLVYVEQGEISRQFEALESPPVLAVEVDLTGAKTSRGVSQRLTRALKDEGTVGRLAVRGTLPLDAVPDPAELTKAIDSIDASVVEWQVACAYDVEVLADEPTVQGQFVRDVLAAPLSDEQRDRVLALGLRALAGHDEIVPGPAGVAR